MNDWQFSEFIFEFQRLIREVRGIRVLLGKEAKLTSARVELMPKSIAVGGTANALIQGFDQFGQPFSLNGVPVTPVASAPADVSFGTPTVNADGSVSVVVTGVNADPGDSISASVGSVTSSADVLTITPPAPVLTSATLVLQ